MRYRYLSYILENEIPLYGGKACLNISKTRSIKDGDTVNIFRFTMESHFGTHIDCPNHFFENGLKISDYPPETWFFQKPFISSIGINEGSVIYPEDIGEVPSGIDLLLIKSGFFSLRGTEEYSCKNPGFSPEVAIWLREERPSVRAIGFDFISLSPYQNRQMGRSAHRAFLDPNGVNCPILIIEDMNLSCDLSSLNSVIVSPLIIEGLDSSPCTVFGIFND